jgi:hypothetical protein
VPQPAQRRKRNEPAPLIDTVADYLWLQVEPARLARVHRVELGVPDASWPMFIIACRVHDPCAPDGWRPAWLEISHDPFDPDDGPSFASPEWDKIAKDGSEVAAAKYVLAVISHAARTRPDAMLIRDMLVALRSAELGTAAEAFEFIEND